MLTGLPYLRNVPCKRCFRCGCRSLWQDNFHVGNTPSFRNPVYIYTIVLTVRSVEILTFPFLNVPRSARLAHTFTVSWWYIDMHSLLGKIWGSSNQQYPTFPGAAVQSSHIFKGSEVAAFALAFVGEHLELECSFLKNIAWLRVTSRLNATCSAVIGIFLAVMTCFVTRVAKDMSRMQARLEMLEDYHARQSAQVAKNH